jgi:hypothetical protein
MTRSKYLNSHENLTEKSKKKKQKNNKLKFLLFSQVFFT